MITIFYLAIWYLICALVIKAFLMFYDMTNRPRFRNDSGDITTEVGYEEDGSGRPIKTNCDDECPDLEMPHFSVSGGTNVGHI